MASASSRMKHSDDYRKAKELDEARKAGLAPAEVDEEGKEINPHIPQYMTNAPWYLNSNHPTLKHQRNWRQAAEDSKQWYDRGVKVFQATKWRKGSCENCGSMSHKTADCLERPRAKGARWTDKHIAADDMVQEIDLPSYEAKRDRWNGYDAVEYSKVVERYETLEAMQKDMKAKEQVAAMYKQDDGDGGGGPDDVDDARVAEDEQAGFAEVKKRVRTTAGGSTGSVRNLRIREDTAKYLLNLDPNSAYYDPKTRSMREDPLPNKPATEKTFQGDNFARTSGDYQAWQALNLHSMQAYDKGTEVHTQALPSLAEVMHSQFKAKKEALAQRGKTDVLKAYGDAGGKAPDEALLLPATEAYVEYDRQGRVIKGAESKVRSRYEEDVMVNNHTTVWGSWWCDGVWGYACCHQSVKNSYCTGKAGEAAAADATAQMVRNMAAKEASAAAEAAARAASTLDNSHLHATAWGSDPVADAALDSSKVAAALKRAEARDAAPVEADERKRKYNSLAGDADDKVTEEDMEAYRLKKGRADDPMLAFKGGAGGGYDLLE